MDIVGSEPATLKAIGKDERWLQDWLCEDPSRLGLGSVLVKAKELRHFTGKGGRLDILAYSAALDTYYAVEVMLGECDADHGFRVLDYWARERLKKPNSRHVAVLIAEDLSGRYKTVIETLAQFLPFIAVELRTLVVGADPKVAVTFPVVFAQPDEALTDVGDEPATEDKDQMPLDEETWTSQKPDFVKNAREMHKLCADRIGPSKIDFSAKSYVSLKKGTRCWLPMWPRRDGFYVYIPGGPGGTDDQPNDFYARVKNELADIGVEPSWTYKYNAGANPIGFAVPQSLIGPSKIMDMMSVAYAYA